MSTPTEPEATLPSLKADDVESSSARSEASERGDSTNNPKEMSTTNDRAERRLALIVLGVIAASFFTFAALYVPRLSNFMMGDMEFTGWVGPVAERFNGAERPYIDFVLPIPPGTFILVNLIQRIHGQELLLHDLWLAAVSHFLMGLLGYAMARPLVGRLNALLVAVGTLVTVLQIHKECTYDHTAQLAAWSSIVLGVYALLATSERRRAQLFWGAGALAGLTLVFKQSTAVGVVGGWFAAFAYLATLNWARQVRVVTLKNFSSWLFGLGVGGLLLVLTLYAIGSSPSAFFQASFSDGSELKGGRYKLLFNLFSYWFRHNAYPSSFFFSMVLLGVTLRWLKLRGGLELYRSDSQPLTKKHALMVGAGVVLVFGIGVTLLATGVRSTWGTAMFWLKQTQSIPAFGLFFGCLIFIGQLRAARDKPPIFGHSLNAIAIVTLATSLLHNASFPGLRPFYDNNPIIPLAFIFICLALDRARLAWTKWLAVGLVLCGLLGPKFHRALSDYIPIGNQGHWAGLYVNERGAEVVRAALRVRALAKPDEIVLVLPEDVQFQRLVDRPRPPVKGAILFVDQYASRLLADDIRQIEANLPKVIVIHPRNDRLWRTLFDMWSPNSATAQLLRHVRTQILPKHYRLDSSYRTVFFREQAELDVYVRVDPPEPGD